MKVWILFFGITDEGKCVKDVFDSEEKAIKEVEKYIKLEKDFDENLKEWKMPNENYWEIGDVYLNIITKEVK